MKPKKLKWKKSRQGLWAETSAACFEVEKIGCTWWARVTLVGSSWNEEFRLISEAKAHCQSESDRMALGLFDPDITPQLVAFIRETVELYGKPGGPWNVPRDPGGWLERGRELIRLSEGGQ